MKIVSILGNTNSGAGAIYEYLVGRKDTNDPFQKKEFRILNDPGGINDLYNCYDSFSLQSFNDSLDKLINLEKFYRSDRNFFSDGLGLKKVYNYEYLWDKYISKIKGDYYYHRYIFSDIQKNFLIQIFKRIITRFGYRKILFRKYYTGVSKRDYRDYTYNFLMKIISSNNESNLLNVLNQCGNFCAPIKSTELLGEPKIICVRRNPLDQYTELKLHKGMKSPKEFINWYLHLKKMESRDQFNDEKVIEIDFEDFVLNHEKSKKLICNFLNIENNIKSNYNPKLSRKNIGKFKKFLNPSEISFINSELSNII